MTSGEVIKVILAEEGRSIWSLALELGITTSMRRPVNASAGRIVGTFCPNDDIWGLSAFPQVASAVAFCDSGESCAYTMPLCRSGRESTLGPIRYN